MRWKTKTLSWISLLILMAPLTLLAAVTTETPEVATSSASTTSPLRKHHHKPKKTAPDSATPNSADIHAGAAASGSGTSGGTVASPGISDNLKGNDAGQPNMGSPDHVPGTTGTSGQ